MGSCELCERPMGEHGRGHCPTLDAAYKVSVMKLVRWIVKCPWCDFISPESADATFARDALRVHLAEHFDGPGGAE